MSLHGLALLGNNNSPIYMCSSNANNNSNNNNNNNSNNNDNTKDAEGKDNDVPIMKDDLFGFFEDNNNDDDNQQIIDGNEKSPGTTVNKRPSNVSMRQEMMFHAAIDRIEEILGSPKKITYKRFQRGSHWIGKICPMEEYEIYGYVTSSDVKILALIERGEIIPLKKRKEIDIKILFSAIHDCYVKHTLNPFSKIKGKIEPPCTEFDIGIQAAMAQYNDTVKMGIEK